MRSGKAAEALIPFLDDEYASVRYAAIRALRNLDPERALGLLSVVMQDQTDNWARDVAIRTLGCIGGEHAVELLIAALQDKTNDRRFAAAVELGRLGDERSVGILIWALRQGPLEHPRVDTRAAWALGEMRATRAAPDLIATLWEALGLEDIELISAVTEALGKLEEGRATAPIIQVLQIARSDIRIIAAGALGKISDPRRATRADP